MTDAKKTTAVKSQSVNGTKKTVAQRFWEEIKGYAEALIIAFIIVTFVFNTVGVVGGSMRPSLDGGVGGRNILQSLLTGDRVFIPKYDTWLRRAGILGTYQRGDVVVVREPANSPTAQNSARRPFFIKRVIGLPGDHLRIEAGQVYVNDHKINQSFITSSGQIRPDPIDFPVVTQENGQVNAMIVDFIKAQDGTSYPDLPYHGIYPEAISKTDQRVNLYYGTTLAALEPVPENALANEPFILDLIVPEKHYFVMGDNRESAKGGSEDSRYFGPVTAVSVAGKASAVIWPPKRNGDWNWRRLPPPVAFQDIPSP